MKINKIIFLILTLVLSLPLYSQNNQRTIKRKVAIGRFSNETQYAKGIFYDKENDPIRKQALDILSSKLALSEKFILLERDDLDLLVFSSTKTQTVEAGVNIRLVETSTGLIIYSDEAKGYAETTTKEVFGIGGKAGYDATLSDKAISAAISQLVENIINKCMNKPWRSYILAVDDDNYIISGGASQGLRPNDIFSVYRKGKKVKNPQTGLTIELPGTKIGTVTVISSFGDTPETELSFCSYSGMDLDISRIVDDYYIMEEQKDETNNNMSLNLN